MLGWSRDGAGSPASRPACRISLWSAFVLRRTLVSLGDTPYDPAGHLSGPIEDRLVLVDLVYREAHRGVYFPLAHDLHQRRDPSLIAGPDRPCQGIPYLLGTPDSPAQSSHRLHD